MKNTTFRKIRGCMCENTAFMSFKATLIPIFDYNDIYYGLLTQQQLIKLLIKLQHIQNRALCTVFKGKILMVNRMHQMIKVAYINDRQEHLTLMYDRARSDAYKATPNRNARQTEAVTLKVPNYKWEGLQGHRSLGAAQCGMTSPHN